MAVLNLLYQVLHATQEDRSDHLKPSVLLCPLYSDLSGVVADNEGSSSEQAEGSQQERREMEAQEQKVQLPEEV